MRKKKLLSGLTSIFIFFMCFAIIGRSTAQYYAVTINAMLGINTSVLEVSEDSEGALIAYESAYGELTGDNLQRLLADTYEQAITEGNEGMVLLRNEGNALPLATDTRGVTLFGHAVVDPLYRNNSAGSSSYNGEEGVDLYKALTEAGFRINDTLYEAYQSSETSRLGGGSTSTSGTRGAWDLGEEDISFYTDALKASWENDFNDVAIVMLAREGGEGIELYTETPDRGISQLALQPKEMDLLQMINDSGKFGKIVVLLNTGNAMEVDWLADYNVDACLLIGCPGTKGFVSVANILSGAVNPSGRTSYTHAVSSLSSPALVNSSQNNQSWTNIDEVLQKSTDLPGEASYYTVQTEGIYVGYKYYETRYEDSVLGRYSADGDAGSTVGGGWNYTAEVSYPFGYGLSYTTFEQSLDSVVVGDDTITVTATVTNTGTVPGKSAVQVYAQTPYGEYEQQNYVEKSAIALLDFGKTGILEPGQSETIVIECDKYLLASYDYFNAKGYILSEGDYYIAIGDDAHDALNNVLAAKGANGMVDMLGNAAAGIAQKAHKWSEDFDDTKYRYADATGVVVTNQFDDADINYWLKDAVTYMTRSDWQGTYPVSPTLLECTDEMIRVLNGNWYAKADDAPSLDAYPNQGDFQDITLAVMHGVDYDDPIWETFLDQLTVKTLASLLPDNCGNGAVRLIGKPQTKLGDGPDGIGGLFGAYDARQYGFKAEPTCYTNQSTLASTWNKALMENRGYLMGEEAIFLGLFEIWAPGGNLLRTPFGGRNFEYYSECAAMTYLCSIPYVAALESKGVASGMKHIALNDQENNRIGVAVFCTEQALREGGLRAFEGAITVAGGRSIMQAFNRLGLVGCSSSVALNTQVLRNEWGLEGIIVTDACASMTEGYRATYVDQLAAGTDSFCIDFSGESAKAIETRIRDTDDGYLLGELRRAAKNVLYVSVNSPAMNGYSAESRVVSITPWWVPVLDTIVTVCIALSAVSLLLLTLVVIREQTKKRAKGR